MEFTLHLHSKLEDYRAATFITCIGSEALDILVYPINRARASALPLEEKKGESVKILVS